MKYQAITSLQELRKVNDEPLELAVKKQRQTLDTFSRQFLSLSPFCLLATAGGDGLQDCSPRGGHAGFIQPLDDTTVALPDRPGNNRLDSLSNIVANPNVGLLSLVPGFGECLRINGKAILTTDNELRERFSHQGKLPASVIVVAIEAVYFHCAKAIIRSGLWDEQRQVERNVMPSLGNILMAQASPESSEEEVEFVDSVVKAHEKETLY